MRGLSPNDFSNYRSYSESSTRLERAQKIFRKIFATACSASGICSMDKFSSLLNDAVQMGFESALGLPHRSINYGMTNDVLRESQLPCSFCNHCYLVYGCEENCALKNTGLPCKMEVKEYLD